VHGAGRVRLAAGAAHDRAGALCADHLCLAVARPDAGWRAYGISVLPSFVAFAGLWVGGRLGLLMFAAGFAVLTFYDLWTVSKGEAPGWYGRLRIALTSVVVACLVAAAQFGPF
jgi:hypothetical protein